MIKRISEGFGVTCPDDLEEIRVFGPGEIEFLYELMEEGKLTELQVEQIAHQAIEGHSRCLPSVSTIYLASLLRSHAAEEAAHYVVASHQPVDEPTNATDAFYTEVVHEALGFLGSRLVVPSRPAPSDRTLRTVVKTYASCSGDREPSAEVVAAVLVREHRRWERNLSSRDISTLPHLEHPLLDRVIHTLGYLLGGRMDRASRAGKIERGQLAKLVERPLPGADQALDVYLEWTQRLDSVGF